MFKINLLKTYSRAFLFSIMAFTSAFNNANAESDTLNILDPETFSLAAHKHTNIMKGDNVRLSENEHNLLKDFRLYSVSSYLTIMTIADEQGQVKFGEICVQSGKLGNPTKIINSVANASIGLQEVFEQTALNPQLVVFLAASQINPCL